MWPGLHRRIDLHCDNPNMLNYVLPHETTHTVLVGNFGNKFVPRWADEGMAVLSEPADKIEAHLRNLMNLRQQGRLFAVQQLVQMDNYPSPEETTGFYAQGVSLVAFLVREKGAQTFTQFLREGMSGNYESALQKHYSYRGFSDLEARWARFAFQEAILMGIPQRSGAVGTPCANSFCLRPRDRPLRGGDTRAAYFARRHGCIEGWFPGRLAALHSHRNLPRHCRQVENPASPSRGSDRRRGASERRAWP